MRILFLTEKMLKFLEKSLLFGYLTAVEQIMQLNIGELYLRLTVYFAAFAYGAEIIHTVAKGSLHAESIAKRSLILIADGYRLYSLAVKGEKA